MLSNITQDYVEKYIRNILPESSKELKKLEVYAKINHIPIVFPEVGQFISVLLKIIKAKNILEVGTAIGYSSLIMAKASNDDTRITTIEKRKDMVEIAEKNINESDYKEKIKIIQGDARKVLPQIQDEYDFIFLDAAKGHYLEFFNNCTEILKEGGVIVSDNVLYKGMVANDKLVVRRKKTIVKRMRDYLKHLSKLEDYDTSIIPIGDGVAVTYKKE